MRALPSGVAGRTYWPQLTENFKQIVFFKFKCHKFNGLNNALPNIWAEQSACTSPDSDYEVEFSVPEYCDRVVIFLLLCTSIFIFTFLEQ